MPAGCRRVAAELPPSYGNIENLVFPTENRGFSIWAGLAWLGIGVAWLGFGVAWLGFGVAWLGYDVAWLGMAWPGLGMAWPGWVWHGLVGYGVAWLGTRPGPSKNSKFGAERQILKFLMARIVYPARPRHTQPGHAIPSQATPYPSQATPYPSHATPCPGQATPYPRSSENIQGPSESIQCRGSL